MTPQEYTMHTQGEMQPRGLGLIANVPLLSGSNNLGLARMGRTGVAASIGALLAGVLYAGSRYPSSVGSHSGWTIPLLTAALGWSLAKM